MDINDKIKDSYRSLPTSELIDRKEHLLIELQDLDLRNMMRGKLLVRYIKCGKPNCRCATGEGHPNLYLTSYDADQSNKTRQIYVRKSDEDKIRSSLVQFENLSKMVNELSSINVELFRRKELNI